MKHLLNKLTIGMLAATLFFSSCKKKDEPAPGTQGNTNMYAIITGDFTSTFAGYLAGYSSIPSGDIGNNVTSQSLQLMGNGFRQYGQWLFKRQSPAKVTGVQKYTIDEAGNITEAGFISCGQSANYVVVDENTGFFFDPDRGLLKLQKFNPASMVRTGEIDLSSSIENPDGHAYVSIGQSLLAVKEGKLYANITFGSATGKGSFFSDPALGYVKLAVIDIASGTYEKTITYTGISYLGYPGNENMMFSTGDDGALYMCSHGFGSTGAINNSAIVRIKKGETDFDKGWIIDMDNYKAGSTFGTVLVRNGKLYSQIGIEAINFQANMVTPIYNYYAWDVNSVNTPPVKIETPLTSYAYMSAQCITEIDGKIYFRVQNSTDKLNGYYVLGADNKASSAFQLQNSGQIWGFAKLR